MSIRRRLEHWFEQPEPGRLDRDQVERLAAVQGPASSAAAALRAGDGMQSPVYYQTQHGIGVYDISKEGPEQ